MLSVEPEYCPFCGTSLSSKHVEGRERAFCTDCERVIWRNADPLVSVLVRKPDRILLMKHATRPLDGLWGIPGGHPEVDESPERAAARELEEERGLGVDAAELDLHDVLHTHFGGEEVGRYYVRILYTVAAADTDGTLAPGSEALDAQFWSREELTDNPQNVSHHDLTILRRIYS